MECSDKINLSEKQEEVNYYRVSSKCYNQEKKRKKDNVNPNANSILKDTLVQKQKKK